MVGTKKGSRLVSSRVSYVFVLHNKVFNVHVSVFTELFISSKYMPAKFLFSQPSEPVVKCKCIHLQIHVSSLCQQMTVMCHITSKKVFKNESHCLQNNPAHCTCVGA